jgi:hypothetical protein
MEDAVKAKYALVDANIEHERTKDALRLLVQQREQEEQQARDRLEDAKRKTREARKQYADADGDFRAGRRSQNARLQQEAEALGAKTYITGTPCRNGHVAPRYTSSGACTTCDRIGWSGGKLKTSESHIHP